MSAGALRAHHRAGRAVLLATGVGSLVAGAWGGLLRSPMQVPVPVEHANWISFHGPLMVGGFLGTLISLERAAGLRALWAYLVPLLTGVSAIAVAAGSLDVWPRWTWCAGSALFVVVSARIFLLQPNLANAVMGAGALAWTAGNAAWALGGEVPDVVPSWLSFLLLIIVGERIELTRFVKMPRGSRPWLLSALGALAVGLAAGPAVPRAGGVLLGLAVLAIVAWLFRFDLAWRTIRSPGLPRYMAVCLLSGYAWLAVAGVLLFWSWPERAGLAYDGILHAFFVGFAFSMIFGHAPVIFPAVLGLPVRFTRLGYLPWALLHASLAVRVAGDVSAMARGRIWGGAGNVAAIALFLLVTVTSIVLGARRGTAPSHP